MPIKINVVKEQMCCDINNSLNNIKLTDGILECQVCGCEWFQVDNPDSVVERFRGWHWVKGQTYKEKYFDLINGAMKDQLEQKLKNHS